MKMQDIDCAVADKAVVDRCDALLYRLEGQASGVQFTLEHADRGQIYSGDVNDFLDLVRIAKTVQSALIDQTEEIRRGAIDRLSVMGVTE